ncbi:MAG: haloalkane dehalogenase [Thermoanaerobaculia bacterium]|nr:haloalkane dehalogenase [Thermoanaerobaculia bacterium]
MTWKALRTPDARFADLPDYPFAPRYVEVDGLRMHYVDEGPRDAAPILMLHGEPSWSYLYRHMIPPCAKRHRVVAPDLVGFGRSDKPRRVADYTYERHMEWMRGFLDALDLDRITLVCQDWGSLLGLRLAVEQPDRFDRVTVGNGFLATGDRRPPRAFFIWRRFARWSPLFPISKIVDKGSFRTLTDGERRAYDAPFPSARYKAGARAFPRLVPVSPDDPAAPACRAAWEALSRWEKPFLTAFSNGDPIMRGGDRVLQAHVPGSAGQPHTTLKGGHFLQEDAGPEWAQLILRWLAAA